MLAVDLVVAERTEGPIFLGLHGHRLDRHGASQIVRRIARHADPRTTMRYDRARVSLGRHATYVVSTFIAGASR
jgi:hypothetical protein